MKHMRKLVAVCAAVLVMSSACVTALAADYKTPAEVIADITGKSVDEINTQRNAGSTCGAIALDAGKLAEFHQALQGNYKDALDARVKNGTITQQQANDAYQSMLDRQAVCDGSNCEIGCGQGAVYNQSNSNGQSTSNGQGAGYGAGYGHRGNGHHNNGGCYYR